MEYCDRVYVLYYYPLTHSFCNLQRLISAPSLHGVVQAINCYCTRPGFSYHLFWYTTFIIPLSYVWVYVNDNEKLHRQWFCVVGGKEAEASGCKYLQGPCKTNEECPPACVAKGYTSGALCSIDPSTRATRCCCFVP